MNENGSNKIVLCNCESKFQDETYGKDRRLANVGGKGSKCTVCGKTHK